MVPELRAEVQIAGAGFLGNHWPGSDRNFYPQLYKDMENKNNISPNRIVIAIVDEDDTVLMSRESALWDVAEQNLESLKNAWLDKDKNIIQENEQN